MQERKYLCTGLACILSLAACQGKDRFAEAAFHYRVDSTVNARLDQLQTRLQQRNDSLILEAARSRAESLRQQRRAPVSPPPTSPRPADSAAPAPAAAPALLP